MSIGAVITSGLSPPGRVNSLIREGFGAYTGLPDKPVTGYQYTTFTTTTYVGYSLEQGTSAVVGDVAIVALVTSPAGYQITVNGDGTVVIASGGNTSRQSFQWSLYHVSGNSTEGPGTVWVNELAPIWNSIITIPGGAPLNNAIDPIILQSPTYAVSPSGDTMVFNLNTGGLPPGLNLSSAGIITGTPISLGTYAFTVRATDITGTSTVSPASQIIVVVPTSGSYVPTLTGLDIYSATTLIYAAGLVLSRIDYAYNGAMSLGYITSQSPAAGTVIAAGTPVAPGSNVTLVSSLGSAPANTTIVVPNVVGMDEWLARFQMNAARLILNTTQYAFSNSVAQSYVISQSIAAGTIVPQWTPVTLTVSDGYP